MVGKINSEPEYFENTYSKTHKRPLRKVLFITHIMTHYRLRFHELVRHKLEEECVVYDVLCGVATDEESKKGDLGVLDFMSIVPEIKLKGFLKAALYHPVYLRSLSYDLSIVTQENKYLLNYLLQVSRPFRRAKVAFMGHGRNFQARNVRSLAERWKRFWATKVDWWFAYTKETHAYVEALGFPPERITIFNNSVDISQFRNQVTDVRPDRLKTLRDELGLLGRHVGVFVGGLYPDKRLEFLIDASDLIRAELLDFELLIIGGGQDFPKVLQLAESRPWIRVLGPQFGTAKAELMLLGHVFMMPGLVGLAILDAGAARLPIVTTQFPWHSPEIAYLADGHNGLMVKNWESALDYAKAVVDLMKDPIRLKAMAEAAEMMSRQFSVEAMAENFARGILEALNR